MTKVIAGPHPDPHGPRRFVPPPDSCDAHCHIFGPAHRFPFAENRTYTPPDSGIEKFEQLQDKLGLSRAVFVQASCHGTDNAALLDALHRGKGRYAGVALIDDSFTEVDIGQLHDAGVRATRFNFVAHLGGSPDMDSFWRIVERVTTFGWHIVLHFDAQDLAQHADLFDRLPCSYVIDHMGRIPTANGLNQAPFQELLRILSDERAWVKLSGAERLSSDGPPFYKDVIPFARALIAAAPNRVLWGTDWPHPNVKNIPDDGDLIDLLPSFATDEEILRRVLVENPKRLYELG